MAAAKRVTTGSGSRIVESAKDAWTFVILVISVEAPLSTLITTFRVLLQRSPELLGQKCCHITFQASESTGLLRFAGHLVASADQDPLSMTIVPPLPAGHLRAATKGHWNNGGPASAVAVPYWQELLGAAWRSPANPAVSRSSQVLTPLRLASCCLGHWCWESPWTPRHEIRNKGERCEKQTRLTRPQECVVAAAALQKLWKSQIRSSQNLRSQLYSV